MFRRTLAVSGGRIDKWRDACLTELAVGLTKLVRVLPRSLVFFYEVLTT